MRLTEESVQRLVRERREIAIRQPAKYWFRLRASLGHDDVVTTGHHTHARSSLPECCDCWNERERFKEQHLSSSLRSLTFLASTTPGLGSSAFGKGSFCRDAKPVINERWASALIVSSGPSIGRRSRGLRSPRTDPKSSLTAAGLGLSLHLPKGSTFISARGIIFSLTGVAVSATPASRAVDSVMLRVLAVAASRLRATK